MKAFIINGINYIFTKKIHNYRVHNDPELETYTYGDLTTNIRSRNLLAIQKNDCLFFLAGLTPYRIGLFLKSEGNFFLIGYFLE